MARILRTFAFLFVLLGAAWPAPAAPWTTDGLDDYLITRWDRAGDVGGLFVAIVQDREGYLWLGSGDGLFRFDGFAFQKWADISPAPLAGTSVRTLFIDHEGRLWVGFDEGGVSVIKGRQIHNYTPPGDLPPTSVRVFAQDSSGSVWLGSLTGLFRLNGERWTPHPAGLGLPPGPILSALYDATGSFFVSTPEAVYRRRAGNTKFEAMVSHPVGVTSTQALCKDIHGHVVVTDPMRGFRIVDGNADHLPPDPSGFGVKVSCTRNGTIWIGTRLSGLWRVTAKPNTNAWLPIRTGLLAQAALAVFEDRDQNVWVATSAGIYRLTPRNVRTLSDAATVVTSDGSGQMWVGTAHGLQRLVRQGDAWQRAASYLAGAQIRGVHVDAMQTVWVATNDGVTGIAGPGAPAAPAWGRSLRQVTSITSNAAGDLWFHDERAGLVKVHDGTLEDLALAPALRGVTTTVIHADRRNRLWFVNERAVELRGPDGDVRTFTAADGLDPGSYRSIYEDQAGVVWLGSTAGLSRLNGGRIESVTIPGVRRTAWIKTIIEDHQGQIWLGIDRGGVRLTRASFQNALRSPGHVLADGFEVFDGFPGTIRSLSDSVAARTPSGQLWFTTDEGIAIVEPASSMPDLGAVPARIAATKADEVLFDPEVAATLPAGPRRVQISWAALELTTPDRVRFRYRLDGLDREWTDAGTRHQVEYANLPPGSYVFRVAAAREGNAWTDSNTSAWEFSVEPHVYQTLWFPFFVAATLAAASWAAWHLRLAQVRRRFTITLAERARVSREVHDTLLQSLVGVALQCQVLADGVEVPAVREKLVRLRSRIDDHIGEAREMIWHLRSPMLERSDFITALQRMADDVVEGTAVKVEFRTTGVPRPCSSQVERELLRIGQEALTNAVRHGRPSLVRIELRFDEKAVRLAVTDNGCGFTPPQTFAVADGHCGLAMMRERVEEIGGRLSIASQPAQGASVEAMVPLLAGASQ